MEMSINGIVKFFLSIILVMVGIYAVKWATAKWNIPVLSTIAKEV